MVPILVQSWKPLPCSFLTFICTTQWSGEIWWDTFSFSKSLACSLGLDSCLHRSGTNPGINNKIIAFPGYLISVISLVFSTALGPFGPLVRNCPFLWLHYLPGPQGRRKREGKTSSVWQPPWGDGSSNKGKESFLSQSFGCRITRLWNTIKQRKKKQLKKIKILPLLSLSFRSFLFCSSTRTWGLLFDLSI